VEFVGTGLTQACQLTGRKANGEGRRCATWWGSNILVQYGVGADIDHTRLQKQGLSAVAASTRLVRNINCLRAMFMHGHLR
jgi:hypothetical protein